MSNKEVKEIMQKEIEKHILQNKEWNRKFKKRNHEKKKLSKKRKVSKEIELPFST